MINYHIITATSIKLTCKLFFPSVMANKNGVTNIPIAPRKYIYRENAIPANPLIAGQPLMTNLTSQQILDLPIVFTDDNHVIMNKDNKMVDSPVPSYSPCPPAPPNSPLPFGRSSPASSIEGLTNTIILNKIINNVHNNFKYAKVVMTKPTDFENLSFPLHFSDYNIEIIGTRIVNDLNGFN